MPDFLWAQDESPTRQTLLAPLWLLEGPYRLGAWLGRKSYDWGLRTRVRLPAHVVSVGNLTVGGSAKTPVVGFLAAELHARGRKVAILSRGVRGRRGREVNVVSDGERVLMAAADVGDEPVLLAGAAPGIPVLAGLNRAALGYRAAALFGAEILVLDDGMQHYRLERELDLVCVDATLGLGNGHVLPRGPLRESPRALRRAHAVVMTRVSPDFDLAQPPPLPAGAPAARFAMRLEPRRLRPLGSGEPVPLTEIAGRDIGMLAALARPDRFAKDLEALGAQVAVRRTFSDHHLYTRRDLAELDRDRVWVTTAKDAVKIPESWLGELRIWVLEEEIVPIAPGGLADWVIAQLDGGGE